jgi:hypothetical protein
MTPETLSCPYCNSSVNVSAKLESGQRVQCPRCQELFPYRAGERGHEIGDESESRPVSAFQRPFSGLEEPRLMRLRWTNRSLAVTVLAVMMMMATVGLIFAWVTVQDRRKRDHPEQAAAPELTRVISVAPAKLTTLGFLPADVNVVVGLHLAELRSNPAARHLLASVNNLEQWTGLKLSEIDHAVLGLSVEERLVPRIVLVVQSRQTLNAENIRAILRAGRRTERGQRTLYRFHAGQSGIEAVLWFADDRTLVLALVPEDVDNVPLSPIPGVERFSSDVQRLLADQLHEGTQAWIVGHAANWTRVLSPQPLPGMTNLTLVRLSKREREVLSGLRTFAAWLEVDGEVIWHLTVEGKDPTAARKLEEYLAQLGFESGKEFKTLEKWAGTELLARELSETLKRHQRENCLTFQAKSSLEAIRRATVASP